MRIVTARIKPIMVVAGVLTCSMLYAAISPQAALTSTFGKTLEGPVAEVVVRNWGILIALVGAMLIYGAYRPAVRTLVLVVAGASKLAFAGLVLSQAAHLGAGVMVPVVIDLIWVAIFALYLSAAHLPVGRQA